MDPHGLAAEEEGIRVRYRKMGLSPGVIRAFRRFISRFYASRGRDLPWRSTTDPYRILVSEFMLQQTQVGRVLAKYPEFLRRFPDIGSLARAPRREVLLAWQGLGYNRRALALHETVGRIAVEFHGKVPLDRAVLNSFPGIGAATAGAIVVFSANRPEVFIETNIRRVFIHLFFPDRERVSDREILPILERTVPPENPREFYYALMDYGSALGKGLWDPTGSALGKGLWDPTGSLPKKRAQNPNHRSTSYSRQSRFQGSDRQVRGIILRRLLELEDVGAEELRGLISVETDRLERILRGLERDGFIERTGGEIRCRDDMRPGSGP
jgi:A/G-specific adenine glycosylase